MFRLNLKKIHPRAVSSTAGNDFNVQIYLPSDLAKDHKMGGYIANILVKDFTVKNNNIRFSMGMVMLKDQEFTMKYTIYYKHVPFYSEQKLYVIPALWFSGQ